MGSPKFCLSYNLKIALVRRVSCPTSTAYLIQKQDYGDAVVCGRMNGGVEECRDATVRPRACVQQPPSLAVVAEDAAVAVDRVESRGVAGGGDKDLVVRGGGDDWREVPLGDVR